MYTKTVGFCFALVGLMASVSPSVSQATPMFTSAYTSLEDKDCNLVDSSEKHANAEIDYFKSLCPGRDGYQVKYLGGDARSWVGLLSRGEAYDDGVDFYGPLVNGARGYFPNVQGSKLEWRYADGNLVAFILRMMAQDINDETKAITNLVVLRVNTLNLRGTCLLGSVDTALVPNANEAARDLADDLSKPCLP